MSGGQGEQNAVFSSGWRMGGAYLEELVFSGTVLRNFHYLNLHSLLRFNTLLLLYTFWLLSLFSGAEWGGFVRGRCGAVPICQVCRPDSTTAGTEESALSQVPPRSRRSQRTAQQWAEATERRKGTGGETGRQSRERAGSQRDQRCWKLHREPRGSRAGPCGREATPGESGGGSRQSMWTCIMSFCANIRSRKPLRSTGVILFSEAWSSGRGRL